MSRFVSVPIRLLVVLFVSFRLAMQQVWANKVRATLTALGIIIGVASVTVVIASVTGLERAILSEVGEFGANNIFAFPSRPASGPNEDAAWRTINFKPNEFDDLAEFAPSVAGFTRITVRQARCPLRRPRRRSQRHRHRAGVAFGREPQRPVRQALQPDRPRRTRRRLPHRRSHPRRLRPARRPFGRGRAVGGSAIPRGRACRRGPPTRFRAR